MAPKRASTPDSDNPTVQKKGKTETKVDPLEGLNGEKFLAAAPNYRLIIAEVGDDGAELESFELTPKVFSSGAYGWHANHKSTLAIEDEDGEDRYLPVNLTLNVNVSKSKPKDDK